MTNTNAYVKQIAAQREQLIDLARELGLYEDDLQRFSELSPYLILDGHRTGFKEHKEDPVRGYIEGAHFSMRFSQELQSLGASKATFLINTLRNHDTPSRMDWIFTAAR